MTQNKTYTPIPLYKLQINDEFCIEVSGIEFKVIKIIHELIYYQPKQVEQGKRAITRYLPHTSNYQVFKITTNGQANNSNKTASI